MVGQVAPALSMPAIGVQASIAHLPTLASTTTTTEMTGIAATVITWMTDEEIATMSSGGSAGNRGVMTSITVRRGSTAETRVGEASSPIAAASDGNGSTATLARSRAPGHGHGPGRVRGLDTGRGPDLGQGRGHGRALGRLDAREGDHGIGAQATPPMRAAAAGARGRHRAPGRTKPSTTSRALPGIHPGTLRLESAR